MAHQFLANVVLRGKIETKTGMHIGGSKEKLEIGGVDSPVLRDPHKNLPYIPGSSLKGKMRMLLEFALDKVTNGEPHEATDVDDEIGRLFGTSAKDIASGPTRLIIRDAYPDEETIEMWDNLDSELLYTEFKPENSLNRLTSEANPRFLERVVKGSNFDIELVYGIYDTGDNGETDKNYIKHLYQALRLLEHSGVGGNISRGYGQIEFKFSDPLVVKRDDYKDGSENYIKSSNKVSRDDCKHTLADLQNIQIEI